MKASIEWVVGILRVGPDMKKLGDKYQASCTIIRDEDSAILMGMSGQMSRRAHDAIKEALEKEGITEAFWDRQKRTGKIRKSRKK